MRCASSIQQKQLFFAYLFFVLFWSFTAHSDTGQFSHKASAPSGQVFGKSGNKQLKTSHAEKSYKNDL